MIGRMILILAPVMLATAAQAQSLCTDCIGTNTSSSERPLEVEIIGGLQFSRMAMAGNRGGTGGAAIDPVTGTRQTFGAMVDLGGPAVQGRVRITGAPSRAVRIDLPTQVMMLGLGTSSGQGRAELTDFVSDLPAFPVLGADGALEFSFGARLTMHGETGGSLRGRIPIVVDYN